MYTHLDDKEPNCTAVVFVPVYQDRGPQYFGKLLDLHVPILNRLNFCPEKPNVNWYQACKELVEDLWSAGFYQRSQA